MRRLETPASIAAPELGWADEIAEGRLLNKRLKKGLCFGSLAELTHVVLESDRRDWRRHGEDDMEIGNGQQFGAAICKPLEARQTLALRAMPIAAGIVGDADLAAILAPLDMTAERRRSACLDRGHDLALIEGEPVALRLKWRLNLATA